MSNVLALPRVPQDTQDHLVLLAFLVPQVHAVEVGLLPLLVLELKKRVVMPHIMEMNQWISKSTLKRS